MYLEARGLPEPCAPDSFSIVQIQHMRLLLVGTGHFNNQSCFLSTSLKVLYSWISPTKQTHPWHLHLTSCRYSGHKQAETLILIKISHKRLLSQFLIESLPPSETSSIDYCHRSFCHPAQGVWRIRYISVQSHGFHCIQLVIWRTEYAHINSIKDNSDI